MKYTVTKARTQQLALSSCFCDTRGCNVPARTDRLKMVLKLTGSRLPTHPGRQTKRQNKGGISWKMMSSPGKVLMWMCALPLPLPPLVSGGFRSIRAHRGGQWGFSCQLAASLSLLLTESGLTLAQCRHGRLPWCFTLHTSAAENPGITKPAALKSAYKHFRLISQSLYWHTGDAGNMNLIPFPPPSFITSLLQPSVLATEGSSVNMPQLG